MENNMLAAFLKGEWTSVRDRAFHQWSKLPPEIKEMIFDYLSVYTEVIKIIADFTPPQRGTPGAKVEYQLVAKIPGFLIPCEYRYVDPHTLDACHYWYLGKPEDVLQARSVRKEFASIIKDKLSRKKTFEVHDSIPSLNRLSSGYMPPIKRNETEPKVVASGWLKRMSQLGLLNMITKLNIDIDLEDCQLKSDVHRIFLATISMEELQRLVVTIQYGQFLRP
jgi:hypothetical protein